MTDSSETKPRGLCISVVIPARNAAELLEDQLKALQSQTYDGEWEVIVADNGSTDPTAEIARSFAATSFDRLRVVEASGRRGINHARNRGIAEARGNAFLLCDADDRVDPEWVAEMAAAFESGAMLVGGSLNPVGEYASLREFGTGPQCTFGGLGFLEYPAGANCGARMEVVDRVGRFDESYLGGGDETDWFWRAQLAGFQLVAVPSAKVDYSTRRSETDLTRQSSAYGASHVRLFERFRGSGMPRSRGARTLVRVVVLAIRSTLHKSDHARRARYLEARAILWGRVRGSWACRIWYV